MKLLWTHIHSQSATSAVVALLCVVPIAAQAGNPWNPYPKQQAPAQPAPVEPQSKYYEPVPATPPSTSNAPAGPSRFAPPDLDRLLSTAPQRQPYATPFGYQGAPLTPYATPPAYNGPPPIGYLQNYPLGPPPNSSGYGGFGPPIGNNSWGGMPSNNFSPFGFW